MAIRILIVEDDAAFLHVIKVRLSAWREDADITVAKTIGEASQKLDIAQVPFDLIILDQNLPDGHGAMVLKHENAEASAVLAVSSDESPEVPGIALSSGATHFLGKRQVSEKSFLPLLDAILAKKQLEKELVESKVRDSKLKAIKTLVSTLQHEINNPLGAVLGGVYLLQNHGAVGKEEQQAVRVIESSANRIRHVLDQLCKEMEMEEVIKGGENLFHVPGDKPWQGSDKK